MEIFSNYRWHQIQDRYKKFNVWIKYWPVGGSDKTQKHIRWLTLFSRQRRKTVYKAAILLTSTVNSLAARRNTRIRINKGWVDFHCSLWEVASIFVCDSGSFRFEYTSLIFYSRYVNFTSYISFQSFILVSIVYDENNFFLMKLKCYADQL